MNNYKIVIDPGHGGDDPGASGNGIIEKNKTLEISKYMYDRFKELGIPVAITRDSDTTLPPTERTESILNKFGNNSNVIVISNHINAGGGDGAEVIYALRNNNNLGNLIADNLENTGQNVRKVYQRRLPSDTSKDYYFIHRNTGVTQPLIVEYGFLDSAGDDVSLLKNNWRNLTEAVVRAIAQYTNTPYDLITGDTYTVKSGDTLWSIAKKYNITVDELKRLNNLTSNTLKIGQVLRIGDQSSEATSGNTYIVKKGDSLYNIASKYNITVDQLKRANNLTSNILQINQVLTIPTEPVNTEDYVIYTVKKGDTLYSIANSYNTTANQLITYNNLNNTTLQVGQNLKIPISNIGEEQQSTEFIEYNVKKGDSLYSIARTYGISVNDIVEFNNLSTNLLNIGQNLKIPISEQTSINYTVKSGDTLYSIARTYNTTVDEIKRKNNLSSNTLTVGQKLTI